MTVYALLFFEFFKIGLFALGGGLVTVPFLFDLSTRYPWFTSEQLVNMIAVAESSPGPVGVNMATYAGFDGNLRTGASVADHYRDYCRASGQVPADGLFSKSDVCRPAGGDCADFERGGGTGQAGTDEYGSRRFVRNILGRNSLFQTAPHSLYRSRRNFRRCARPINQALCDRCRAGTPVRRGRRRSFCAILKSPA